MANKYKLGDFMDEASIKKMVRGVDLEKVSNMMGKAMAACQRNDYASLERTMLSGVLQDYQSIKQMARQHKCQITDLIVLAPQNDPFYTGAPADIMKAEWFADLWQRFGYTSGVHLRQMHYRVQAHGDIERYSGGIYQNNNKDWQDLCAAGKYARYLGLVSPDAFVDHRNPAPHVFAEYDGVSTPDYSLDIHKWNVMPPKFEINRPSMHASGYDYSSSDQEFHVEVWLEKSTMDSIILPLGREYGVNVVTSLGFQSITSVLQLLRRVQDSGKPGRILYISDFDAAGDAMPASVARQIEFWKKDFEVDVQLEPICLTRAQVVQYNLPTAPMKQKDKRQAGFKKRRNTGGAVELDALEALYPGVLVGLVRAELDRYIDLSVAAQLQDAEDSAEAMLDAYVWSVTGRHQEEIEKIEAAVNEIYESFTAQLAPHQERLQSIQQAIRTELEERSNEIELPDRPMACTEDDERTPLFDSRRSYVEQLNKYRERKAG